MWSTLLLYWTICRLAVGRVAVWPCGRVVVFNGRMLYVCTVHTTSVTNMWIVLNPFSRARHTTQRQVTFIPILRTNQMLLKMRHSCNLHGFIYSACRAEYMIFNISKFHCGMIISYCPRINAKRAFRARTSHQPDMPLQVAMRSHLTTQLSSWNAYIDILNCRLNVISLSPPSFHTIHTFSCMPHEPNASQYSLFRPFSKIEFRSYFDIDFNCSTPTNRNTQKKIIVKRKSNIWTNIVVEICMLRVSTQIYCGIDWRGVEMMFVCNRIFQYVCEKWKFNRNQMYAIVARGGFGKTIPCCVLAE